MEGFLIVFFSRYSRKKELAQKSKNRNPLFLIFLILIIGFALYLFITPDVSKLKKENPQKTSFMQYRERGWKKTGNPYIIQQRWVPLSRISHYLIKAVLIAEDDKFWRHEGFDYDAIRKAFEKDIREKKLKLGGSTITQQLVKNLYLSPEKNPVRKMREAIITWRIERALSKKRILELYLNVVEWGDYGIFGIEAASRHYYGKPASALNAQEASRLAAVLPNPRKYNPLSSSRYVSNRAHLIYSIMLKRGIVVPEYKEVVEEGEDKGLEISN
jgi:monofunctional biosynthetic peptidoglycan transglycosylase